MSTSPARLGGVDALRSGLVFAVVVFHATRPFDPFDFYVKAQTKVDALGPVVLFGALWGMPLFFVLAGVALWHSLERRAPRAMLRERALRLLLPYVAGLLLIVPPQLHMEALQDGAHVSYGDTLGQFFDVHWAARFPVPLDGPTFESAHLWFLVYLFAFTLVLLPVFARLRTAPGRRLLDAAAAHPLAGLVCLAAVVLSAETLLGTEDAGGWNRWCYPAFLLAGFCIAAGPGIQRALAGSTRRLGATGLALFVVLALTAAPLYDTYDDGLWAGHDPALLVWRSAKALAGVLLVCAIAGMAAKRWRASSDSRQPGRHSRIVASASEAALPVYILHQTVAVVLAYWVVGWDAPLTLQWAALTALTLLCTVALYAVLRRADVTRVLIGMRPRRRIGSGRWAPTRSSRSKRYRIYSRAGIRA